MKGLTNSVDKYPLLGCDFCTIDIGHVLVKYPSTSAGLAASYPMIYFFSKSYLAVIIIFYNSPLY